MDNQSPRNWHQSSTSSMEGKHELFVHSPRFATPTSLSASSAAPRPASSPASPSLLPFHDEALSLPCWGERWRRRLTVEKVPRLGLIRGRQRRRSRGRYACSSAGGRSHWSRSRS
uniref:Uncharacterized protein n=1 Tax=Arundo donax TaxID=35708 RepID=A0A0A9DKK0_ARUDO